MGSISWVLGNLLRTIQDPYTLRTKRETFTGGQRKKQRTQLHRTWKKQCVKGPNVTEDQLHCVSSLLLQGNAGDAGEGERE